MTSKTKEKPFRTTMRISKELHSTMKARAALQGISMQKWLTELIESNLRDLKKI